VCAHFNEVHVQTLVSSTIFAKAVASKVLEVYSPALFVRRVGCKLMLGTSLTLADSYDVLPDVSRQIVDMMGIPRIIVDNGATFRGGRELTRKQNSRGEQEGADYH
jgi:hypothetical protein